MGDRDKTGAASKPIRAPVRGLARRYPDPPPGTHDMFNWVAGRSYPEGSNLAAVNRARRRVK